MGKVSKGTAQEHVDAGGVQGHYADVEGYTIGFETYSDEVDMAPLFAGLPDDACQSPHWGVLLKGKLVYRYTDGSEETIEPGDAYYVRPGHTPEIFPDTEVVEFSPTEDLRRTIEVVTRNMEASQASAR